ncbi:hypothetical protein PoB_001351200 [Plakobranchus ocellatus]|uniref:Uncharacterized protein n=1 Tax=Plakobranchus ocellatus TaxID=259542 RepID=A0AAV3YXT2_9GAST|nr:hypothetical protein PoB_001351200 [Plakobranchus ocellatus]
MHIDMYRLGEPLRQINSVLEGWQIRPNFLVTLTGELAGCQAGAMSKEGCLKGEGEVVKDSSRACGEKVDGKKKIRFQQQKSLGREWLESMKVMG